MSSGPHLVDRIKLAETLRQLLDDGGFRGNRRKVASAIGVTEGALSQYVTGQSRPTLERLVLLADFFGVGLDYLVFGQRDADSRSQVDYGPLSALFDQGLYGVQRRVSNQTAIAERIGRRLAEQIQAVAHDVAGEAPMLGGMLTDDETLALERFSRATTIVTMTLSYDLHEVDGIDSPGRFLPVVAQNVAAGRRYRFLLPAAGRDWSNTVDSMRTLLHTMVGTKVGPDLLQFRTAAPVYAGAGIYQLDLAELNRAEPLLADRLAPYIDQEDFTVGYALPASADQLGDSLMDLETLRQAKTVLEKLWRSGKPL